MDRKALKAAFPHTIPVLMGYLAIGLVFGWMLSAIGYGPVWAGVMSLTIYAGSGQYLGVTLLEEAAPLLQVAFLTFIINFRHLVYGLSLLEKFKGMGWRKLYMMFALTDETYALLAGVEPPEGVDRKQFFFWISLLDHLYWIAGSLIGSIAGSIITINTEGIDFAMTALFTVIFVERWRACKSRIPAYIGFGYALISLLIFGAEHFLLPALIAIVLTLFLLRDFITQKEESAC